MGLFRSSSKDKGGKGKKSVAAPPPNILQSLRATPNSERHADFGSIRFQNSRRPLPSKYVRVSGSDMDSVGDLFGRHGLLMETWGLKPPCAIISVLNRAGALRIDRDHVFSEKKSELIVLRGLAEAAELTNAWVFDDGLADGVSGLLGKALRDVNVPLVGIAPWKAVYEHEQLEARPNGQVHLYGSGGDVPQVGRGLAGLPTADSGAHMLESNHTHFIFCDDGQGCPLGSEWKMRVAAEKYLCSNDVSGDQVLTPMVYVVMNGDETTLQRVHTALRTKEAPVLVLKDSGGAAEDIYAYCYDEARTLPKVGPGRPQVYVDAARELLPDILKYGKEKAKPHSTSEQLTYFPAGSDSHTDNDTLALFVQSSLLNDCETMAEEIMLAVAWGDPVTLKKQLEKAGKGDTTHTGMEHNSSEALEAALIRCAADEEMLPVVEMLLEFNAPAAGVRCPKLFVSRFNKYDVDEDYWAREADDSMEVDKMTASTTARRRASVAPGEGRVELPGRDRVEFWPGWQKFLGKNVDNYEEHIKCRRSHAKQDDMGRPRIATTWLDLMMWASFVGRPELAEVLWAKTREPLRAALLASMVCKRLSRQDELRAYQEDLQKQSHSFERLALELLDSIGESEDASPLLTMLLCAEARANMPRELLWPESALDISATDDGLLSVPCMEVVAHRHAQFVLDHTFAGNYPGSPCSIKVDTSLLMIIVQSFFFFVPGTLVEVMPPTMGKHADLGRVATMEAGHSTAEWDPDLIKHIGTGEDDLLHAGLAHIRQQQLNLEAEASVHDVFDDFRSGRFVYFFFIPKVKFALAVLSHALYLLLLSAVLLLDTRNDLSQATWGFRWAAWLRREGNLPNRLDEFEVLLWAWTLSRLLQELKEVPQWNYEGVRLYLRDNWNKVDLSQALLVIAAAGLRITEWEWVVPDGKHDPDDIGCWAGSYKLELSPSACFGPRARWLYSLVALLSFTRTLQYLRYYESLGVLVIIMEEMLFNDVASFLVLLVIFSLGFGVAFSTLAPFGTNHHPFTFMNTDSPFWQPFWGVVGDFDIERLNEDTGFNDLEIKFFAPLLMWIYMFFTTIVLVNLLIAAMSDTYADVKEKGTERWQFERAQLILEYKDGKPPVPPPLNFFWTLFHDLPINLIRMCRRSKGDASKAVRHGFTLVPSPSEQRTIDRLELDCLKTCLDDRHKKRKAEIDFKVQAVADRLEELEESNNERFEVLQGSLDTITRLIKNEVGLSSPPQFASSAPPLPAPAPLPGQRIGHIGTGLSHADVTPSYMLTAQLSSTVAGGRLLPLPGVNRRASSAEMAVGDAPPSPRTFPRS